MSKFQNHYANNDEAEVKVKKDKRSINKNKRKNLKDKLSRLTVDDMYNEDIDYDFDE